MALACILLASPVAAKESITLCYERADVLPWRTANGSGLNFELLKLVGNKLDIQFEFLSMPWKRCLEQLKSNEVGGAFAVSYTVERSAIGVYPGGATPDPNRRMHTDKYVLIRKKGSPVQWDGHNFSQLQGAVGVQLGYSVGAFLRGMRVPVDEGSQRATELAQKLIAGRIGAAAVGGSDAVLLLNGPMAPELEALPMPLVEKPYYLVLSKSLAAAQPQLAQRIWKQIEDVRNSAEYKKMLKEATEGGTH
ncbi:ABC transporter substrate-binding protein [Massilia sp. TS11]|uniref:substrate-binding periplasmic protein n=1 Tax=Massilia sp. TS11 TaxID=2908003 RepID=UPI001EDC5280|nr:transporter substrate-binding domain-containing protein [Massilia sp. TS11]MCG2584288.1 transporter substrate-binding domain-containing protein [Massilia sp. TS11]